MTQRAPLVLVVTRSAETARAVCGTLRGEPLTTAVALDGRGALRTAAQQPPDLVVSDLRLADMDAWRMLRTLRELPGLCEVPAIGLARREHVNPSSERFQRTLDWPVEPARLIELVRALLERSPTAGHRVHRPRVLLVHGDDAQRRLALVCLRHAGYNVTAAAGAAEALEFCRRQPPDAVVSELRMSGMDGYELAFALRQDPRIAGAPIILTCTPSDPVDLELVTAAGASALVTETADLGELVDAIRSRLEPPRRADTSIDSVELAFMAGLGVGLSAGGDGEGVLEDVLARCTEMGGPESPSADQTGHDEPLIGAIAAQLARWLGRARANAALSRRQRHVVGRLTRAAEFRDEETANHTERVSAYSGLLARLSGLDGRRSELIAAASAMHDIGKLGIPDSILRKAGPLTATERIHMQRHAEYGHRILAGESDPLLDLAATIALTHHERWDGAGYPYGISGPDIPLAGRIVAIGDVFDALTSDRVYRPAMTVQEALGEMRAGRGTHFDPELLDLFVSALPQVLEIRRRHPDRVSERPAPVAIA